MTRYANRFAAQDLAVEEIVFIEQGRVYSSYTPKPTSATVTRRTKTLVTIETTSGSEYTYRWNKSRERWLQADSPRDIYERDVLITAEEGEAVLARIERSDKIDVLRGQARFAGRKLYENHYPSVQSIDEAIDALQIVRRALAETEAL